MAKSTLSDTQQVEELISKLDLDIRETVQTIRAIILATDPEINEQVKWNSPSFYYTGAMKPFDPKEYKRDIVVCNLHRGKILLVFPTGAKVKDKLKGKDYPDGRKIITINGLADVKTKQKDLQQVIKDWLAMVEK
ncbi:DUF1801 domain-containing protein [Pedobacter polaris]|uniref:DUF1801 domain-containing protein n=1 Tax=Pedobacter polaris TaxID=2571273 RepID=A0A4U1CGG6_9SPHI|nr:DUF1801 domain-containing protein [Pedobacter polaris]TKC05571.1 DUF1801 domain-containing protein [Pedobacter polaris]